MEPPEIKLPLKDTLHLYHLMGEALCMVQTLEDALAHSMTMKRDKSKTRQTSRQEADKLLDEQLSFTLGKSVKAAKVERLYDDNLQTALGSFLTDRNWLVHSCMPKNRNDLSSEETKTKLFQKIRSVSDRAEALICRIEEDMMEFASQRGVDMSDIKSLMDQNNKSR